MRKIKEVLRLKDQGRSHREISAAIGISLSSVSEYTNRAREANLSWDQVQVMSEWELDRRLFKYAKRRSVEPRSPIDMQWVHRELKRTGVTMQLLWLEYSQAAQAAADGTRPYQYSQFCQLYRQFVGRLHPSMRQVHRAGDKAFVDYSGKKPVIVNAQSGEVIEVELFVMVLGASNYTYAEATSTQQLSDFVASNIRALEYFGCAPSALVPDRLKTAVQGHDWYDPEINATYLEMARHYELAIIPARPYRPKDKAKVEAGVLVAQRWILARVRNRTFFSLAELNEAIGELLEELNTRAFKKLEGCRRSAFETIDRPAMHALPPGRYEMAQWETKTVNIDYHVEYDHRIYSVPCSLIKRQVDVRATASAIEILHGGQRVASHIRSYGPKGTAVTREEHRPRSHREYGSWTPERIVGWAATVGPSTAAVAAQILAKQVHPEMGYRSCMALIRTARTYGNERTERASAKALLLGSPTRKTVETILKNNLDHAPVGQTGESGRIVAHDNIRGPAYYEETNAQQPSSPISSPQPKPQDGDVSAAQQGQACWGESPQLIEGGNTPPHTFPSTDLPVIPTARLPHSPLMQQSLIFPLMNTKWRLPN